MNHGSIFGRYVEIGGGLVALFLLLFFSSCSAQATDSLYFKGNYIQGAHYDNVSYDDTAKTTGLSMAPTIFTGNSFLVRVYHNETLKEGQIVGFQIDNTILCYHRIIAVYPTYIITQGDNNNGQESVNLSQVRELAVGVLFT